MKPLDYYLFKYWSGRMTDEVNEPSHYNQNGIEVIEVIETYAKDDFRLANVIKYVCRCEYKGNKLQDLKKAQWYLNRCVQELEAMDEVSRLDWEEPVGSNDVRSKEPVDFKLDGYYSFVFGEDAAIEKKDELYQSFEGRSTYEVHCPPDRIAGDDNLSEGLKAAYYKYDPLMIKGYCANCDKELAATQPHVTDYTFDEGVKFCSAVCVEALKVWQGR